MEDMLPLFFENLLSKLHSTCTGKHLRHFFLRLFEFSDFFLKYLCAIVFGWVVNSDMHSRSPEELFERIIFSKSSHLMQQELASHRWKSRTENDFLFVICIDGI